MPDLSDTSFTPDDFNYMQRAIELAKKGHYTTSPNPRVGCVIVKDGKLVGEGYHKRAGSGHAEVNALAMAGEKARGATAYVTLEPCSHYGRTPPCAEALVKAGVAKVIAATYSPQRLRKSSDREAHVAKTVAVVDMRRIAQHAYAPQRPDRRNPERT